MSRNVDGPSFVQMALFVPVSLRSKQNQQPWLSKALDGFKWFGCAMLCKFYGSQVLVKPEGGVGSHLPLNAYVLNSLSFKTAKLESLGCRV